MPHILSQTPPVEKSNTPFKGKPFPKHLLSEHMHKTPKWFPVFLRLSHQRLESSTWELQGRKAQQVFYVRVTMCKHTGTYILKQEGWFSLTLATLGELQKQETFQGKPSTNYIFSATQFTQLFAQFSFTGEVTQPPGTNKEPGSSSTPPCDLPALSSGKAKTRDTAGTAERPWAQQRALRLRSQRAEPQKPPPSPSRPL